MVTPCKIQCQIALGVARAEEGTAPRIKQERSRRLGHRQTYYFSSSPTRAVASSSSTSASSYRPHIVAHHDDTSKSGLQPASPSRNVTDSLYPVGQLAALFRFAAVWGAQFRVHPSSNWNPPVPVYTSSTAFTTGTLAIPYSARLKQTGTKQRSKPRSNVSRPAVKRPVPDSGTHRAQQAAVCFLSHHRCPPGLGQASLDSCFVERAAAASSQLLPEFQGSTCASP